MEIFTTNIIPNQIYEATKNYEAILFFEFMERID